MAFRRIWRSLIYRLSALVWPIVSLFGTRAKFHFVYRMNLWGNPESISGDGSTMEYTANLRQELPVLFEKYRISRVFDAPCGDYNWFRHVVRDGVSYVGGDIVEALVEGNQQRFGDGTTDFFCFDVCRSPFPEADLWICRDCMFHLPTKEVMAAFENFARGRVDYVLTTSHVDVTENVELPRSGFRMLNLELPPYSFPAPEYTIEDWVPGFPRRVMGLWRRDQVSRAVAVWKSQQVEEGK